MSVAPGLVVVTCFDQFVTDVRIRLEGSRSFYEAQTTGSEGWVEVGRDMYLAVIETRRAQLLDRIACALERGRE